MKDLDTSIDMTSQNSTVEKANHPSIVQYQTESFDDTFSKYPQISSIYYPILSKDV
jgi:hypothetical protein